MKTLIEIKEDLQDILEDYEYNIKEYHAASKRHNNKLGFLLKITGRTRAKQALSKLNTLIEQMESEKLTMVVAKSIYEKRNGVWDYHLFRSQQEPYIKDANAAINVIKEL